MLVFRTNSADLSRRGFLSTAFGAGAALGLAPAVLFADDEQTVRLPFENGERPLVQYPQKRRLIRHTSRPPQLETPFEVFNEGLLTPNDAFFVRYHLTSSPPPAMILGADKFRLEIKGSLRKPLSYSLAELQQAFPSTEVVAVNQCSGNSRGFFNPRVPGGQLGNGAMGCARWKGVRLADVLQAAEPKAEARQVLFNGLDRPILPASPDFIKALDLDAALAPEPLLAWEMNGEPLPWLNGYPLRLVVPGHYGTYWVKHLSEITLVDQTYQGFYMNPAYRIPDDPCAHIEPGTTPKKTVPIQRLNVRSFITSLSSGSTVKKGDKIRVRGIAFDGGSGIDEVLFSSDQRQGWRVARLGENPEKFAFREWTVDWTPERGGLYELRVKATNRLGQSQPLEPLWNPSGYMRNVVETVEVQAV